MLLGDKSRTSVHKWKEKTQYLPEYLSESTLVEVKKLAKEAEEIISEGKIDDVVFTTLKYWMFLKGKAD